MFNLHTRTNTSKKKKTIMEKVDIKYIEMIKINDIVNTEIKEPLLIEHKDVTIINSLNSLTYTESHNNYIIISPDDYLLDEYEIVSQDEYYNDDDDLSMDIKTDVSINDNTDNYIKYVNLIINTINYFKNTQQINDNNYINETLDVLDDEINALRL